MANPWEEIKLDDYEKHMSLDFKNMSLHKVFGAKENAEYVDRKGAYLIPVKDDKVGIVKTPKGFFFLGGGIEKGESHNECIKRECLEEAGFEAAVGEKICSAETYFLHETIGYFHPIQTYYAGSLAEKISEPTESDHKFMWIDYDELSGKMYLEMQNWALERALELKAKETK